VSYVSQLEEGVLNTVYDMTFDKKTNIRECKKVNPKNQPPYEICAIAVQATFSDYNFSFLVAPHKVIPLLSSAHQDLKGLEIALNRSDNSCVFRFFYISEENGSFDDRKLPYRTHPPLSKDEKGNITQEGSEKCGQNLKDEEGIFDLVKIRKIHEKGLEAIAATIKENTSLPQTSEQN
jgi:hypothetical protein